MKKVIIYADGASRCNGAKDAIGAYGAIITCGNKKKEISKAFKGVTNNQMELMGVIEALKILKAPCSIKIFSDSKYVCDAFNQNWIEGWKKRGWKTAAKKPVANRELWEELIRLTNIHEVTFSWVKGHADNEGNQRVDELCNLAMDNYNETTNKCECDEIGDIIQGVADRKGMTKEERADLGDKIISEVRSSKKKKENANDKLNKWMNGIDKKILTNEKKKILKENMGRVSSKNIDFNKIRDEWRDELEEERVPDRYDFMSLVKDILEDVDDGDLDNMKEQLIDTINFMIESEKRMAKVGLRIRRN